MGLALNVQVYRGGQPVGQLQFDSETTRTVKVGRLGSAQIKLDDPQAARIHAVLEFSGNEVSLIDMGSTSGTAVNGQRVQKVALNHGDQVTIGNTTLVIGLGAPAAQPAPHAVDPRVANTAFSTAVTASFAAPQPQPVPMGAPVGFSGGVPGAMVAPPLGEPAHGAGGVVEAHQPVFDGGAASAGPEIKRITQARLSRAAVESKPHPSLPPEGHLTKENRVLEMRVYWGEVLLAMHHYSKPKKITIGESKHTDVFISSEGLPVETFPLIRYHDDDYVLSFSNEMEGEVEVDHQVHSLRQLRGSSQAQQDGDLELTYNFKMPTDTRALVHWGGATFAMRFVPPTKPVPNAFFKNLDLQYLNTLVVSIFFHIAAIVTVMVYPYDTVALRQDLFDNETDRFAKLILEEPKETESTKDLLEKLRKKQPPKPDKTETKPDLQVNNDNANKNPKKSQAQKKAEVAQRFQQMFSGAGGGGSLLGGGGGGSLSGTLSNVIGTAGRGSSSAGLQGLNIRGSGPNTGGGLGTSRGIGGIGTSGRLGGGGTQYGAGVGGLGGRKDRGMITLSTPVVMGALPPEVIKKVINQNRNQVRYCYEVELQRKPNLEGRVAMRWIIAATGFVAQVQVKESTLGSRAVENCIKSKIKTWKFPPPAGGGIVEVNYPFVLRAS